MHPGATTRKSSHFQTNWAAKVWWISLDRFLEEVYFPYITFLCFVQKCWTYDLPKADRWGIECPSWTHNFNDLSILNDSNDKNLVASNQKILFWHLISLYDIWNLGEKWLRYDNDPDHCMQWNSNQKPFFPTHFWQLLGEASQLLSEWIDFNTVCGNRLQMSCSVHWSYKN